LSQIYKRNNGGGGGDSINYVIGDYTGSTNASPLANVLKTYGGDATANETIVNYDAGISIGTGTAAICADTHTMQAILTNRAVARATTINATETTILTFDMGATAATFSFKAQFVAYNTTDDLGAVVDLDYGSTTDGATGSELGVEVGNFFKPDGMTNIDVDADVSGNLVYFYITGLVDKTINWKIFVTYITTTQGIF
jgi:hypothetical protein